MVVVTDQPSRGYTSWGDRIRAFPVALLPAEEISSESEEESLISFHVSRVSYQAFHVDLDLIDVGSYTDVYRLK